jgi:C4-dicarboxylate-specific signal transduction histidine kinase
MVGFLVFSGFIIALGEANRRSKARSEWEVAERSRIEDALRSAQAQLESRVQERTAELNRANQNLRKLSAQLLTCRTKSVSDSHENYMIAWGNC